MKREKMIYLKNISKQQEVFIPKGVETRGALVLRLHNTINQSVIRMDVTDSRDSDLYYIISLQLPADMQSGEYEYSLLDDAGVVSTGLLIVRESSSPIEYNNVIQYEQC